jgi:uncharacterized coiled-coil DUF342 family protein
MNIWEESEPTNGIPAAKAGQTATATRRKHIHVERKKIDWEDSPRTDDQAQAAKLDHTRKILGLIETKLGALEKNAWPGSPEMLDVSIIEEYLEYIQSQGVLESPEDAAGLGTLRAKTEDLVSKALAAAAIEKRPSQLAREVLPGVNDILEKAKRLVEERLFVPPLSDAAIRSERTELDKKADYLKQRDAQLLDEYQRLETERQKCVLSGDPTKDAAKAQRLAELDEKWQATSERARDLMAEEEQFAASVRELEPKHPTKSSISLIDGRRKSLFKEFDPNKVSSDEVTERLRFVRSLAQSFDEKLDELEKKIPAWCRDTDALAIDSRLWTLARLLGQKDKKLIHRNLLQRDLYPLPCKSGSLYHDIKEELAGLVAFLETLAAEYQSHLTQVNQIKDLLRQGNAFLAEKRFKTLVPKFKEIRYQSVQSQIEDALRIHTGAKQLLADATEYHGKSQGLMGKLFKDRKKLQELQEKLSSLQSANAALPKSELKTTVSGLLLEAESRLRG